MAIVGGGAQFDCVDRAIHLDCYPDSWQMTVGLMIHESIEYAALVRGTRYQNCSDWYSGTDRYRFMMDHAQFSQICLDASRFLTDALPVLAKYWNRNKTK